MMCSAARLIIRADELLALICALLPSKSEAGAG